jgi:hypothetical protein
VLQLSPWLTGEDAENERCGADGCGGNTGDGEDSERADEEHWRRGFQGPIQMADGRSSARCSCWARGSSSLPSAGSFYDDSAQHGGSSSDTAEFPSLDCSNFPALPTSTRHTRSRQQPQQQPQQHVGSKEHIVLEFAQLPRSHRLQVPRCPRPLLDAALLPCLLVFMFLL